MTPDPFDREFRSIQVEHAGSAECILRRSMKGCSAGLRPAPATSWSNSNSRSRFPVGSRGGSGCGDAVNPSLGLGRGIHAADTPATGPTRLRQISAICNRSTPRVDEPLTDNESIGVRSVFQRKTDLTPCRYPMPSRRPIHPSPGDWRRRGGVGWQDRWRHGWRHRAPMEGFTACPASPHRPAQPADTPEPAVAFDVALA